MSEDKDGATEALEIMWAAMPEIVRKLARNAREREDPAERNEAIRVLVERGFLSTHQPTDDDLRVIEEATDEAFFAVLRRTSH
jgi:hypothetical protein